MSGRRAHALIGLLAVVIAAGGCEVDSFFNPAKTGRFEHTPTTISILDRIDVIESERDPWARATNVTPEDLLPSDLTYRIRPGDVVTVEVFELYLPGQLWRSTRRIDAGGYFRMPAPIGDVRTAGLTVQELQDELIRLIDVQVMANPEVNVLLEDASGFQFTIYGAVAGAGLYALRRPDLRLLDAIAQAGGVPLNTERIYVIRQVPLSGDVQFEPARRDPDDATYDRERPEVDIEELIRRLDQIKPEVPPTAPDTPPESDSESGPPADVSPGLMQDRQEEQEPPIDIDDLEPIDIVPPPPEGEPAPGPPPTRAPPTAVRPQPLIPGPPATTGPMIPPVIEARPPDAAQTAGTGDRTFIYVPERREWVAVGTEAAGALPAEPGGRLFAERVIEIPYQRLKQGDSSFNIVIRPNDRIYVAERDIGVVYIDGEIARPGVYNLPSAGRLTLSRLVAAAGGFSQLAIPTRVDLTRVVGPGREATVRLNVAAIRKKTEPDLYLKPDDHVIIGTSFFATPLAVFRNGLRATYGFGFLLDRNFGNDVFGPPPVSRLGG